MAIVFIGLVLIIGVIGGITLTLFFNKKQDKKETTPKEKNVKKIILIIVIILILIIGFMFASRLLKINFNFNFGFGSSNNEKFAICSDNSNTVEYIQGNLKETHIKHISHSKSSYLSDRICSYLETIAYSYDKDANVQCGKQDFYATYYRKNSFEDTIYDYTNNIEYYCVIYDDTENSEKNKIVGSWCGYNYDDTDLIYTFNSDGTIEMHTLGTNYKGYYEIKSDNNISYGTFLTNSDYYFVLLDDNFYYDENEDKIILNSKMNDDKYNVFTRCN